MQTVEFIEMKAYKGHPWFDVCRHFCARYDQASFDPGYPSKPLSYFEPMLREVFTRKPFDPSILREPDRA